VTALSLAIGVLLSDVACGYVKREGTRRYVIQMGSRQVD
jgi:hypothetical protein